MYTYDHNGMLPIHVAAKHGSVFALDQLLTIDVKQTNILTQKSGDSPLMVAILNNQFNFIEHLFDHYDPDVNLHNGVSALEVAIENNYTDILELLLDKGADVEQSCRDGRTIFEIAYLKSPVVFKMLRRRFGKKKGVEFEDAILNAELDSLFSKLDLYDEENLELFLATELDAFFNETEINSIRYPPIDLMVDLLKKEKDALLQGQGSRMPSAMLDMLVKTDLETLKVVFSDFYEKDILPEQPALHAPVHVYCFPRTRGEREVWTDFPTQGDNGLLQFHSRLPGKLAVMTVLDEERLVFETRESLYVTPIWYRFKWIRASSFAHTWCWTPYEAVAADIESPDWISVSDIRVPNGEWAGQKPAELNVQIIYFLASNKVVPWCAIMRK